MLDERKAAILRAVVQEYIETAEPVGSGRVAAAPGVGVSSATVRTDMATLEAEGYLIQPHTSAGRVPTDKGYRYFVDSIAGATTLDGQQAQEVRSFFASAHGELEQLLASTSHLLSNLTAWTGVVVAPDYDDATVRSAQLVSLGPSTVLAVVVFSDAAVDKHTLELGEEVGPERVDAASVHLASQLVGANRNALPSVVLASGDATVDRLVDLALGRIGAAEPRTQGEVFMGGVSRMAGAFEAVETVQQVLGILEQQFVVVTLLRDVIDRGLQVAIGAETGMAPLANCALVVAPYRVDGEHRGTIGVLGPTRMNYRAAIAAVDAVSRQLEEA